MTDEPSKVRVPVPSSVADSVLFGADRTCCKCRIPGRTIQIHHIDDDPSNNTLDNLAVLCLECHNETLVQGGFGRQLTSTQIIQYRDDWSARVLARRDLADRLAAEAMAATVLPRVSKVDRAPAGLRDRTDLITLIRSLPELRRIAYQAARPRWAGSTADMVEATWDVIRVFEASWASLVMFYPAGHFDEPTPRDYLSSLIAERAHWHGLCYSTAGIGSSGTIVQVLASNAVLTDVERMLEEMVVALTGGHLLGPDDLDIDLERWRESWQSPIPDADP